MDRARLRVTAAMAVSGLSYFLISAPVAAQSMPRPLFSESSAVEHSTLPAHARAASARAGVLEPQALESRSLAVELADGRVLHAHLRRTARDAGDGTQSWIGTFPGMEGSLLVLSRVAGVTSGFATYGEETF
jgi:hypothetical protein